MRLPGGAADTAILSALIFPMLAAAAGNIDCSKVVVDKSHFNLETLGGARSIMHGVKEGPSSTNTTYTIDICKPLGKAKHVDPEDQCPHGTRLCAIQRQISGDGEKSLLSKVFPIAGELIEQGGKNMDAKWELLKNSKSNEDSAKDGLRLEMNGGFKKTDGKTRPQKAIVEFICDKSRTGLEHLPKPDDPYEEEAKARWADDDKKDGDKDKDEDKDEDKDNDKVDNSDGAPSLQFVRYDTDGKDADVLRLQWKTKYACSDTSPVPEHWGVFTWFLIIAFMSTAAYLIFGSWLNYNRYGARGWDLLPHGDTIRDIPYLLKDWFRGVLNTVQGGGSRGGYAAV